MNRPILTGTTQRLASFSIGMLVANFVVALIVDQFGVPLHQNVVASGTLALATGVNLLVSKYM